MFITCKVLHDIVNKHFPHGVEIAVDAPQCPTSPSKPKSGIKLPSRLDSAKQVTECVQCKKPFDNPTGQTKYCSIKGKGNCKSAARYKREKLKKKPRENHGECYT